MERGWFPTPVNFVGSTPTSRTKKKGTDELNRYTDTDFRSWYAIFCLTPCMAYVQRKKLSGAIYMESYSSYCRVYCMVAIWN